jgi:hypothetical protein
MSNGEEIGWGQQELNREQIIKPIICNFINGIDPTRFEELKKITQEYKSYDKFDSKIKLLRDSIAHIMKELNTKILSLIPRTFKQSTKDTLNQQLTSLNAELNAVIYSKSFVDNIHQEYLRFPGANVNVFEFFLRAGLCRKTINATAVVIPIDKTDNVPTDNVSTLKASKLAQKYLKYKQKYLSLKNKVN